VGENIGDTVGYARTAGLDRDDRDMMAEPLIPGNHHATIASPAYTCVGLGVIYLGGQLYFIYPPHTHQSAARIVRPIVRPRVRIVRGLGACVAAHCEYGNRATRDQR
jgi:hypothetical protein